MSTERIEEKQEIKLIVRVEGIQIGHYVQYGDTQRTPDEYTPYIDLDISSDDPQISSLRLVRVVLDTFGYYLDVDIEEHVKRSNTLGRLKIGDKISLSGQTWSESTQEEARKAGFHQGVFYEKSGLLQDAIDKRLARIILPERGIKIVDDQ